MRKAVANLRPGERSNPPAKLRRRINMAASPPVSRPSAVQFNRVFLVSLCFVAGIGGWGLIDPEGMTGTALGFTDYMLAGVGWYWLLICTGFVVLAGYMAFGPYGHIKLGADDEEPEFSTAS